MTDQALTILPTTVQHYLKLLDELPAKAQPDDLSPVLAQLTAAALGAVGAFADSPEAVVPARRALLVAGPAGEGSDEALGALQSALVDADRSLDAPHAGFSRLLQNALESGEVQVVPRVDVQSLRPELRERLRPLQDAAAVLDALDDLSHALSAPPDLPAAAVVLEAVRDVVLEMEWVQVNSLDDLLTDWLLDRGAKTHLIGLFALRGARFGLSQVLREKALKHQLGNGLALWILADRLARGVGFGHQDRPELEALLAESDMVPLAALDSAQMWDDDDDLV